MTEKPNSVCKWCGEGIQQYRSSRFWSTTGGSAVCGNNPSDKNPCHEPVAEPAEPSAGSYIGSEEERVFLEKKALGDFAVVSAEPTAERGITDTYEEGDENPNNVRFTYLAAPQPVARSEWKPCPICQSDYDGVFCHACRNQPAQSVAACEGITACTQKEACLKVNRCLINLPQPAAGEGPLRISFDIGGVLSKYPEAFRPMVDALQRGGAHVYVITDMHEHEKSVRFVRDNGYDIPAERILNSDYTSHGEGCKAETIKQHGIKIHLDDFAGYCAHTECVSLFVWPNPSKPYYADDFKTDGTEGDFGRRKAAKI